MRGKRRVQVDAEIPRYAYLDGKHTALVSIEKKRAFMISDYQAYCQKLGYTGDNEREFLRGVREVYAKEAEDRFEKIKDSLPKTILPRSVSKPTNQMDVEDLWSQVWKRPN